MGFVSIALTLLAPQPALGQQFESLTPVVFHPGWSWYGLSLGDIDNDGDPDLVYAVRGTDTVYRVFLHENNGGAFGAGQVIHAAGAPSLIHTKLFDADGDGDLDLVGGGSDLWFFRNTGGAFASPVIQSTSSAIVGFRPTDVDGDGDVDLIAEIGNCYSCAIEVKVFTNDGTGVFTEGANRVGYGWSGIQVGDIDGDGDSDYLTADQPLAWHENQSSGITPWVEHSLGIGQRYGTVGLADIDGDGDLDVLATRDTYVDLYVNGGGGLFGQVIHIADTGGNGVFGGLAFADFDGDGDLDIATRRAGGGNELVWLENQGNHVFAPPQFGFAYSVGMNVMIAEDIDVDGYPDLMIRTRLDTEISFSLNNQNGVGLKYFCPATQNSTQSAAAVTPTGTTSVFLNNVTLSATSLPSGSFGFFITSLTQGVTVTVPNSQGALCVVGSVGRFVGPGQILNSGPTGQFTLQLDLLSMPTPTGLVQVQPGETWNFQAWYRDANPTGTSNFTDAVSVTFQ